MSESSEPDPLIGRLIAGKFRIERLLGAGAMGRVYLAEQTNLGKQVALKVLHNQMAGDPSLAKRFYREAKSASMLSHPNILQIIDFGDDAGLLFIAMELLSGRDLYRVIKTEWPMSLERIGHVGGQILGALDEAHAKGVVHRDLKPENVMLLDVRGETDFVKVCDFGIAKVASERDGEGSAITMAGMVCGTPEYMSPEQARGEPLDGRSDLYAMAVILYQMVAGDVPFRAESALGVITKHLHEEPTPPSQRRNGNVPPALEAVVLRGLRKNKAQRFETAAEMKAALLDAVGIRRPGSGSSHPRVGAPAADIATASTGVATPAATVASPTQAPSGGSVHGELAATGAQPTRRRGLVLGALGVAAVLGATVYVATRRPAPPTGLPPAPGTIVAAASTPVTSAAPGTGPNVPAAATTPGAAEAPNAPPAILPPTPPAQPMVAAKPAPPKTPTLVPAAGEPTAHPARKHEKPTAKATPAAHAPAEPPATPTSPNVPTAPKGGFAAAYAEGQQLLKAGDVSGAVARYEEAARLNPSDPRTQRELGKCYNRLGQRDRAQPYLKRYLELAPDASDAAFIRAILDQK